MHINLRKIDKFHYTFSEFTDERHAKDERDRAAASHLKAILGKLQILEIDGKPKVSKSLCFIDFVFFEDALRNEPLPPSDVLGNRSVHGYYASLGTESLGRYKQIIGDHLKQGGILANHACIQSGFPAFSSDSTILENYTTNTLDQFFDKLATTVNECRMVPNIDLHYVEIDLSPVRLSNAPEARVCADGCTHDANWEVQSWSIKTPNMIDSKGVLAAADLRSLASLFSEARSSLKSQCGAPLEYIYLMPIAWVDVFSLGGRRSTFPVRGGSILIGSSIKIEEHVCNLLIQWYSQSLSTAFLHMQYHEAGSGEGFEDTTDVFAHQVRTLAGKVSSGWLVEDKTWGHEAYTKPVGFNGDRRAPLPRLYEAVGTVLTFWSMSVEPDHLFPAEARSQFTFPPKNIHDIARYAMYHAKQSC